MVRIVLILAVIGLFFTALGGSAMAEENEFTGEEAVIKQTFEALISWALEKDTVLALNSVAQDEDFFYFSPDNASTISGFEMFKKFMFETFMGDNFKALWYKTKEVGINISKSGDVAWYHCLLDDVGLWNGQEAGWHDVRWTGVLEKRDGKWVVVQMHFSFALEQMRPKPAEEKTEGKTEGEG